MGGKTENKICPYCGEDFCKSKCVPVSPIGELLIFVGFVIVFFSVCYVIYTI